MAPNKQYPSYLACSIHKVKVKGNLFYILDVYIERLYHKSTKQYSEDKITVCTESEYDKDVVMSFMTYMYRLPVRLVPEGYSCNFHSCYIC